VKRRDFITRAQRAVRPQSPRRQGANNYRRRANGTLPDVLFLSRARNCRNSAPTRNLPRAVRRGYHDSRSDMRLSGLAWNEAKNRLRYCDVVSPPRVLSTGVVTAGHRPRARQVGRARSAALSPCPLSSRHGGVDPETETGLHPYRETGKSGQLWETLLLSAS
jgi:hypothetical protein